MSLAIVESAKKAADDKKGLGVMAFDLMDHSDLCSYQVICSGNTEKHTQALCAAIIQEVQEKEGIKPVSVEGKSTGHWILLDYGDTLVHIFLQQEREYYALERLWPSATPI